MAPSPKKLATKLVEKVSNVFKTPTTPPSKKRKVQSSPPTPTPSQTGPKALWTKFGNALSPRKCRKAIPPTPPPSLTSSTQSTRPPSPSNASTISTTSNSSTASRPGRNKAPRKRDLTAQLMKQYSEPGSMDAATSLFDRCHLRPLVLQVQKQNDTCKELLIAWFCLKYGSMERAKAILDPGAPVPPLDELKHFLYFVSTNGRSGFKDTTGWSYITLRGFVSRMWAMCRTHRTQPSTPEQREQINNAILEWVKKDKTVTSQRRVKRSVREEDFIHLLTTILSPEVRIQSNRGICRFSDFS
ncbi:hypothetical protein OF83DRAFT_1082381 [Amylostereum chailletii]|nr:hypothetical protein OF83DRAFT_1082381 [Amylostereum chailletii]